MSTLSRTVTAALTAATLLAVPAVAAAQPSTQPSVPLQPLPEAPAPAARVKHGGTATALALGGALSTVAVVFAADAIDGGLGDHSDAIFALTGMGTLLIGPSAGHIYAGEYKHALRTSALRGVALGATLGGLAMIFDLDNDHHQHPDGNDALGATLFYGGAAALVGLTVYDVWDAHKAATRTNARHAFRVTPTALATAHGPVAGLALGGSF